MAERGAGPEATFGRRYLFANVDPAELAVEVRAAFSMTPDLSLELYAQPFVSSGKFLGLSLRILAPLITVNPSGA